MLVQGEVMSTKENLKIEEFKEEMKIYVIDSEIYSTMLLAEEY